ncbi:PPE domain-containing protein [Rhodococcoides kyotonense]|uniref:PPE domain-containing protein n=1 Tax=Rhodococcoides kyotonense TaxID=398843 RepID=A0A239KF61_9NOCA|nr:hypothetical protein [Rhodococcus kyotonensis]SNT16987.1 hypothetical protein SAMN05421642_110144 [Rhodococcus kyotonensis]
MSPEPAIVLADLPETMKQLETALPALVRDGFPLPLGLAVSLEGIVDGISKQAGYAVQYDGLGAASEDVFDAMTHADIYGKVSEFAPDTLVTMANNWRTLGANASRDAGDFATRIGGVIGQDWQGAAAEAAGNGVQQYAASAVSLMIASHTFSSTVSSAHGGLAETKSSVPPPQPISKSDRILDVFASVSNFVVPGSMKNSQFERDEAEEQARTIMKTLYQPAIRDASDRIPVLPQALDPLNGGGTAVGSAGPSVPYGSWPASNSTSGAAGGLSNGQAYAAGAGSSVPGSALPPSSAQETATQAAAWAPGEAGAGSSPSPLSGNTTGTSNAPGGGSVLAGPVDSRSGSGGLGGRASGGMGSGGMGSGGSGIGGRPGGGSGGVIAGAPRGGSPLGGSGLGGSGLGGSGLGGSGLGGSGGSAGGSGGAGGIAGSAAAPGRAGAPGMGAMAPGAGRGGADGDDIHKTPGYLVDAVNGDELIGTLPLVAPPVLGE